MMNLWEVALIIISVTVMVVNLWNIYFSTKLLKKYEPFLDKCMKVCDAMLDQTIELFKKEDDED